MYVSTETILSAIPALAENMTLVRVIVMAVALLFCFAGYKCLRVAVTLAGFCGGASIGLFISEKLGANTIITLILAIILGLIVALVSFLLYKVGVFVLVFFLIMAVGGAIVAITGAPAYGWFVLLAVAIVFGILGVILIRPVVILTSGLCNGLTAVGMLIQLTGWSGTAASIVALVGGLALGIFGIVVQFKTTREKSHDRRRR